MVAGAVRAPLPHDHLRLPGDGSDGVAARRLVDRLVARSLAMGGTCTGEHGVGMGKIKFLEAEHGREALDVMRAIKQALDPHNLMNPGKVLPIGAGS